MASDKKARIKKARETVAGLIKSGKAKYDVRRISTPSLETTASSLTKNSPAGRGVYGELRERELGRASSPEQRRRKRRGK